MSNYLEASNTSNNSLLEKLDYDDYEGKKYHINFKINTDDTIVRGLYENKKTQLESTSYKNDPYKDSGVPIYMPETKICPPMAITEVDFKVESIIYYKHKVRTYANFMTFGDDENTIEENCGCTNDASGNLHTDNSGNEINQDDHEILSNQPFHSGLSKSYFKPMPYFLVPYQGIYAKKLMLLNSVGLIDSSYRGNLKGYFFNTSTQPVTMYRGDKVLNVALPDLSINYRLNLFDENDDVDDHTPRQLEKQQDYFPTPFEQI